MPADFVRTQQVVVAASRALRVLCFNNSDNTSKALRASGVEVTLAAARLHAADAAVAGATLGALCRMTPNGADLFERTGRTGPCMAYMAVAMAQHSSDAYIQASACAVIGHLLKENSYQARAPPQPHLRPLPSSSLLLNIRVL